MPSLSSILSFLMSSISVPVWLLLLLLLILLIQFFKIYIMKGVIKVEKSPNLTDNKLTKSIVTTVEKMSHNGLTNSIITTAKKIQKDIAAKKQVVEANRPIRENIMRLLFTAGDEGRLRQSLADELKIDSNTVLKLIEELINEKLAGKRRTTFGETYYLTKAGSEYCVQNKLVKI